MKFAITATIATLFLANLGFAAPAASPDVESLEQRSPDEDWKTKLGWDGKVTPIEELGEVVSVSSYGGPC